MNHLAKGDMNELTQVKSLKLEREKKKRTNEIFSYYQKREKKQASKQEIIYNQSQQPTTNDKLTSCNIE